MRVKKSIFSKLIGSFILFAVMTVLTFMLCLIIEALVIGNGNAVNTQPDGVIGADGTVNLEAARKIGGWVEELDGENNVTAVCGDKKTDDFSYTEKDLLELTSAYGKTDYIGFYTAPENSGKRFLVLYDRSVMELKPTIIVNGLDKYNAPNIVWIFFPLSIAEIVLISLYLKKKIKNPLDKIVSGMERLKSGDSSARINVKTEAEFEQIVEAFNLMAEQLEREKDEKNELIRKKNRTLLELSHDIKTPVATIKSYANALEEGIVPEEKKQSYYHTIDVKADRVKSLTEDMFLMLKMDDPEYTPVPERTDMCEYLRQLCAEYYDELTEAGFEFDIDIPEGEIPVMIDTGLFSRVVGNLLSNARKYNKTGGAVEVVLSAENGEARLSVADDGEEINGEFAKQMFGAFSRGDKARKTDGGTGLGLYISKIIAEKHGGSISYAREDGKNVFTVTFPCA